MKTLAAVLLACLCATANAKEVVSTGVGTTENFAVQNAKLEATNQVAGEFIVSRTNVSGDDTSNQIVQYSGGFVRTYKVLSVENVNGLYKVSIKADVDADKVNTVVSSTGKDVSSKDINDIARAQENHIKRMKALAALSGTSKMFSATITNIRYDNHGDNTDVTISYDVKWSPKWYDDLYHLAKLSGTPANGVNDGSSAICFAGSGWLSSSDECYDVGDDTKLFADQLYGIVEGQNDDGTRFERATNIGHDALYDRYEYHNYVYGVRLRKDGVIHGTYHINMSTDALVKHTKGFHVSVDSTPSL